MPAKLSYRFLFVGSLLLLFTGAFFLSGCDWIGAEEEEVPDLSVIEERDASEFDLAIASEGRDQAMGAAFLTQRYRCRLKIEPWSRSEPLLRVIRFS